jgi:glycogen debranching enzyme
LTQRAIKVLQNNWSGSYTKPAPQLYPHQWSWDSGFVAIGYSHFDPGKAQTELLSLFKGQWKNGMLPHIVYHQPSDEYFPNGEFWQTNLAPEAPESVLTSGLTHPPIHATAAWHIYENAPDKQAALGFLQQLFPKLMASHRFLYAFRDVEQRGLVASVHPWETGIDNSPKWDSILDRIVIDKSRLPPFERKDLDFVSAEERPSDEAYSKFVYLIEVFKESRYEQAHIMQNSPFLVYDVLFNSVLFRANLDLLRIASRLGESTKEIERWTRNARAGFEELLWDSRELTYHSYDLRRQERIHARTASCALPLFAEIPNERRALQITQLLHTVCPFHQEALCVAVPTYDRAQKGFEPSNYWRGPIWVNINWLLYKGLVAYGFKELAEKIQLNIIRLVDRLGFYEYYYPNELRPLGSRDFSWTAALLIDLIHEQPVLGARD